MIDPMVSLSFSVYSNKGAYALLLGSGTSRASGIPTGWEVVLDLIRKTAKLENEDCEPDPAEWYRQKHHTEPDYSKLLDEIAKTPTERQQLLRGYFEPTEDERAQGLKAPSIAHRAIAKLVASGHLRIIVTTNFDRLMEKALDEVGVAPTIISTADQLEGALPLAHSGATIIKLHGDYLDTRIKNTDTELAAYDVALDKLLDRVFDEYGLIVCGWSADWDAALRAAIERCPSRRFTTFWTTRPPLSDQAKRLSDHRKAEVLQIGDANQLFDNLWINVQALGDLSAPHPLSAKMAVATIKRYLVEPTARIRLRDLIHDETEKLVGELNENAFPAQAPLHPTEIKQRLEKYDALCETQLSVIVAGCYWGESQHMKLWVDCLERIANSTGSRSGITYLLDMRRYPALLLLYGAGLAAITAGNYQTLASILTQPKVKNESGKETAICLEVFTYRVLDKDIAQKLPGLERHHTPVSDYLFDKLRLPLREYIPRDDDYQAKFDYLEYLMALVYADLNRYEYGDGCWAPIGCFGWRNRHFNSTGVMGKIDIELETDGANWAPLKAGLFGGSIEQAKTAKAKFDEFLSQVNFS
ncbi:MAG: SIR2 family protein [Gallionella sp.]|nr:SIR2 family protein [Gallionella sp.]